MAYMFVDKKGMLFLGARLTLCGTFTLRLRSLPCCISVPTINQKLLTRLNSLTVLSRGMSSLSGSKALM